jgi:hypothetical protein
MTCEGPAIRRSIRTSDSRRSSHLSCPNLRFGTLAVLALIAAFPFAASACKKGNAVVISDAGEPAATIDAIDAAPPVVASASAPRPRVVSLFDEKNGLIPAPPPTPRSWAGWYKCKGRLQLTQFEDTVSGRANSASDDTSFTCKVSGDTCIGTETEIRNAKGKAPPEPRTRKLTLRRDSSGGISYNVEGGSAASCPKL